MKAKNISGHAPGGKRKKLADVLPLRTPILIQIFPIYACNFKCRYCTFSVEKEKRGFISDKISMNFKLYQKCIDEITLFQDRLKVLRFVGMGEPLLYKKIADMVEYAVLKNVANKVEILSNASLLTPEMSDSLISAGLSRLVVSIQGTTKEKYKDVSGVDIDYGKFIENLRYFFNKKKTTHVHIKIIDYALYDSEDEKKFYKLFGDVCDTIGVEHAGPIFPGVDYGNVLKKKETSLTQFGLPVSEVKICPQPFFHLQINPDGKVVPCYSVKYPLIMGDCNNQTVNEIWSGKTYNNFRRKMLDGTESVCETCSDCNIIKHRLFPEDVLNENAERLKKFYE